MPRHLPFRHVHLDFHTSPDIDGVGSRFDKKQFQEALKLGHVNFITLFSKCHHGWSYHPTAVGKMHPHLSFDLLRAQMDACKEIGVQTPVYLSAGVDTVAGPLHPEWRRITPEGSYSGWGWKPTEPGFHQMCFRSPYLDYLCDQIREVCRNYPDADGIFLDIINKAPCCCRYCQEWMAARGLDLRKPEDLEVCAEDVLHTYYERTTAAARELNPDMPVFHNSGNIAPGHRDILRFFSHLELESLPTGGWGYDHYPLSAKYVQKLGLDFLGMTGKFQTSWGEFGGFKHPNALRYECAAMLAYGSKCSVGDQLHPDGEMDLSTYGIIGAAYQEVEKKEPWCDHVRNVADVGVLMECAQPGSTADRPTPADTGAGRMLLEAHILFDMLDNESDFSEYRVLVLPDAVKIGPALKAKLDAYLAQGGKLFLTGASGLDAERKSFLFDVGATTSGVSEFNPDYVLPKTEYCADYLSTPNVVYAASQRVTVTDGESLGDIYDPYFNREYNHFCSHQHTPYRPDPSGYACGVRKGNVLYLAHPIFSVYFSRAAVAYREYAMKALRSLLGFSSVEVEGLPSTGRVTLQDQAAEKRQILHLLYANTIRRGGPGREGIEVVEELLPLHDLQVTVRPTKPVTGVRLVPEGRSLAFETRPDGSIAFTVDKLLCHQMVELSCSSLAQRATDR